MVRQNKLVLLFHSLCWQLKDMQVFQDYNENKIAEEVQVVMLMF